MFKRKYESPRVDLLPQDFRVYSYDPELKNVLKISKLLYLIILSNAKRVYLPSAIFFNKFY